MYLGAAGGTFTTTYEAIVSGSVGGGTLGHVVAGAGDANGDAFADVVIGVPASGSVGGAWLYHGGAGAFDLTVDVTLAGTSVNDQFGIAAD